MSKILLHSDRDITAIAYVDLLAKVKPEKDGDIVYHDQMVREVEIFVTSYNDYGECQDTKRVVINADAIVNAGKKIEEIRTTVVKASYQDSLPF